MERAVEKCSKCGCDMYNGDNCYYIDDNKYCEECINDSKVILDVDEYTYQDYLCEKYERECHEIRE